LYTFSPKHVKSPLRGEDQDDNIDNGVMDKQQQEMESNNLLELKNVKERHFTETIKTSTFSTHWSMEDDEFKGKNYSVGADSENEVSAIFDTPVPKEEYKSLLEKTPSINKIM